LQVVHVLRDDQRFARPRALKPRQRQMRGVGLRGGAGGAAGVVECAHAGAVGGEGLRGGDLLRPHSLPQPARAAERAEAGLGADPGPCQDDDAGRHAPPVSRS
jgi:hypothetical protein